MRIAEIIASPTKPKAPLTPAQAKMQALKQNVNHSKAQLKAEKDRQQRQRELDRQQKDRIRMRKAKQQVNPSFLSKSGL